MALAYLKYDGTNRGKHLFRYDIGSSKYFTIGIANEKGRSRKTDLPFLQSVFYGSPVREVKPSSLGRGAIELPAELFKEREQYVQLISFRERNKSGRAYSSLIKIHRIQSLQDNESFKLPPLGFSKTTIMRQQQVDRVHFQFSENNYSEQQFFNTILQGISSILPKAIPLLTGLIGQRASANTPSTSSTSDAITQLLGSNEMVSLLQKLMAPPTVATAQSNKSTKSKSDYSEAKVAPALLALMPAIGQILDSKAVSSLIESPQKLLQSISDAAFKVTDRELSHLEKINPGVDGDNQLIQNILAAMTLSMISDKSMLKFKKIGSVKLKCTQQMTELMGRQVNAFSKREGIVLPLTVITPKPIGKAIVQILVKDAKSMEVLADKRLNVTNVQNGVGLSGIVLNQQEIAHMPDNRDLNLCISLVFKNKKGEDIGVHKIHPIVLINEYTVGRIKPGTTDAIPLNDIIAHRDFWHKVWEDDFKGETKELNFQVKYYYRLNEDKPNNAQIETKLLASNPEEMGHSREINYKLKSGFEAGLHTLNQIMPQISSYPALNPQQLKALDSDEFAKNFDTVASSMLKFRGKSGDMSALWVFPELEIKEIVLRRATQTDQYGQIIQFEEGVIYFPVPKQIHFVGVRSER